MCKELNTDSSEKSVQVYTAVWLEILLFWVLTLRHWVSVSDVSNEEGYCYRDWASEDEGTTFFRNVRNRLLGGAASCAKGTEPSFKYSYIYMLCAGCQNFSAKIVGA